MVLFFKKNQFISFSPLILERWLCKKSNKATKNHFFPGKELIQSVIDILFFQWYPVLKITFLSSQTLRTGYKSLLHKARPSHYRKADRPIAMEAPLKGFCPSWPRPSLRKTRKVSYSPSAASPIGLCLTSG